MALIKQDAVVADEWVQVDDDTALPDAEAIVISLARWQRERASLEQRNGRLGLRLKSDETAADVAADLHRFALIAVEFPTFKDGRGYSTARLLRERHGYGGELRAVGNVLPDQALFLERCGFDSYEVGDEVKLPVWSRARQSISGRYQPAVDGGRTIPSLRQTVQRGAGAPQGSCAAYWAY